MSHKMKSVNVVVLAKGPVSFLSSLLAPCWLITKDDTHWGHAPVDGAYSYVGTTLAPYSL
jgi:hypothetical protein